MACDVASPFPDHMLENPDTTNLDAIAEFNATFGDNNGDLNANLFSNTTPTPHNTDFCNPFNATALDATLSPDPSTYQPQDFQQGPPYYHSIEPAPAFDASNLRYQTRQRSISEPPDGFMMHHRPPPPPFHQQQPAVTFHRGGHFLGDPQQQHPKSLKSLPKTKQGVRTSPYKMKAEPPRQHPRYHLRRTQTQPAQRPLPTSSPFQAMRAPHPMAHLMGSQQQHQQRVFEPLPLVPEQQQQQQHFVSSRVCTPTPPQQSVVDPALMASPPLSSGRSNEGFMVSLTTEQLRGMINEAVQKALRKEGQEIRGGGVVAVDVVKREEEAASDQEVAPDKVVGKVEGDGSGGNEDGMHNELFGDESRDLNLDTFRFDAQES